MSGPAATVAESNLELGWNQLLAIGKSSNLSIGSGLNFIGKNEFC